MFSTSNSDLSESELDEFVEKRLHTIKLLDEALEPLKLSSDIKYEAANTYLTAYWDEYEYFENATQNFLYTLYATPDGKINRYELKSVKERYLSYRDITTLDECIWFLRALIISHYIYANLSELSSYNFIPFMLEYAKYNKQSTTFLKYINFHIAYIPLIYLNKLNTKVIREHEDPNHALYKLLKNISFEDETKKAIKLKLLGLGNSIDCKVSTILASLIPVLYIINIKKSPPLNIENQLFKLINTYGLYSNEVKLYIQNEG